MTWNKIRLRTMSFMQKLPFWLGSSGFIMKDSPQRPARLSRNQTGIHHRGAEHAEIFFIYTLPLCLRGAIPIFWHRNSCSRRVLACYPIDDSFSFVFKIQLFEVAKTSVCKSYRRSGPSPIGARSA